MLRIGVLTDGAELRLFNAELIRKIQAAKIGEVVLVIQQSLPRKSLLDRIFGALKRRKLLRGVAFKIAVWMERRVIAITRPEINDLFNTIPVDQVCDAELLPVKPIVSPSGWVHRFTNDDVGTIKSKKLDLILSAGSGILRGDILSAASNGIISFQHGDNRSIRGGPAGFWEVYERCDYTGFVIQRLTEELDAGEVLMRSEVATQSSYLLNQYHLYKCSINCMIDLLARIERDGASGHAPGAKGIDWYSGAFYTTPSVTNSLAYLLAFFWRKVLMSVIRRVLVRRNVWELRLLNGDWRNLVLWKAKAISPPRGKFWADPFIVSRSDEKVIFFEEYEFERGKGHIAALVSTGEGSFTYAGPLIKASYHLSFPYVFRYHGDHYMCPESHEARAIQLWRCTSWPLKWEYHKTILADINAVDTMIFERDGRWWLFTNLDRDETGDHCELHVYHSESPLSEIWTPLPSNPVVTGASRARNAGILYRGAKLYRLAQSQGFNLYGRSIKLFEITDLSEWRYSENLIAELSPNHRLKSKGIHHLSACEDAVVFDSQRPRFFWTRILSSQFFADTLLRRQTAVLGNTT